MSRRWTPTGERRSSELRVDGGAARNDRLLQFQADLLGVTVERPRRHRDHRVGAASLAGLAVGVWDGLDALAAIRRSTAGSSPR